jgi:hypothetical protein
MLTAALSLASLNGFAQPQQTAASPTAQISLLPKLDAKVIGTVLDPNGVPLEGCLVYAFTDGSSPPRDVTVPTDFNGNFAIDVYSGHVLLFAYKESDLYHNNIFGFDVPAGTVNQAVEVRPGETVRDFVLHLPRQSALLRLDVYNADTNDPVNPVEYELCREDHPADPIYCMTGAASDPGFQIVVPPDPISIKITAPNYMEWRYLDAKTGSSYLTLKPTENRTLPVYLRMAPKEVTNVIVSSPEPDNVSLPLGSVNGAPVVEVKPEEYGSIEGVVVDRLGKPVDGAYVYAVGDAEGKLPLAGRWPGGTSTTTDTEGKFVLGRVVVDNPVSVWASKDRDYYAGGSILNMGLVPGFNTPKVEGVDVKPGQTVTVRLQLAKKAGKIKLYVRDADTKKLLVDGIFSEWCADGVSMSSNCGRMIGGSDYESLVSTDVDHSVRIEARDGLHEEWEYRNPKTGSRYYRARSGKTETVNVYLRKTPWHKGTIWPEPPPDAEQIGELYDKLIQPSETNSAAAEIFQIAKDTPAARDFMANKLPSLIVDQLPIGGPETASPVWLNAVRLAGQLKFVVAIPALKRGLSIPQMFGGYDDKHHGASTVTIEAKLGYDIVGRALADIGDPSVPVLAEILSTGNATARRRASWILTNIDSPASRKAMRDHLPHERDSIVRELIGKQLHLPVAYTKKGTIWLDGTRPQ